MRDAIITFVLTLIAGGLVVATALGFWFYPVATGLILSLIAALCFLISLVIPIHWYIALFLAKHDFVFTRVPEAHFKVVVRFGAVRKILMSKKGCRIDEHGDIVDLASGELPEETLPGGLRLIGWPGIDKIYTGKMKFKKSLPDGSVKDYDEESVSEFFARVDYSCAVLFVKCEDKNNLPIFGHATLLAHVVNPEKSLFATANFYNTMVGLVLPVIRECLESYTFDELKDMKKEDLDESMWKELKAKQPDGSASVIEQLRDKYGIGIVALRIVNIDPPEEYRDITLTKWKAEREADAAEAVAKAEARKAAGPIGLAVEQWVKSEAEEAGETVAVARKRLRESGEYDKHKKLLADQINRSRRTVQERKVDITSGGEPLEGGTIASVAGTIAAAVIAATAGKDIKDDGGGGGGATGQSQSGKNPGGNPGIGAPKPTPLPPRSRKKKP